MPFFKKKSLQQVRFWYQLSQDSQLTVSIRTPWNLETLLDSTFFKSKTQWTKATVQIRNTTGEMAGPFQVSTLKG